MSNVIGGAHGAHPAQTLAQGGVGGAQGQFNGQAIAAGPAQPRATSALKTAWLEVQHFFKSLVGMRVSTPQPQQLNTASEATRGLMHAMTKREPDTLAVLGSLSTLLDRGNFTQDEARQGLSQESTQLFRSEFQNMSDMQLMRLHKNFGAHPELTDLLTQSGTGALLAVNGEDPTVEQEDPSVQQMTAAGKVNDLGFLAISLQSAVRTELEARGFAIEDNAANAMEDDPIVDIFAREMVASGGDTRVALDNAHIKVEELRQRLMSDSLEQMGMGRLDG